MTTQDHVDGNAAAGVLSEIFAVELTSAVGQCAGCGMRAALAQARTYLAAPGLVMRCDGCEAVLVRVVTGPTHTWLDLRGLAVLQVDTPQAE